MSLDRGRMKKPKKLTREQKKAVWAKTETNAGAGWESKYQARPVDPRVFESGSKEWQT